jgi:uncharacterized protein (DUF2141 family)
VSARLWIALACLGFASTVRAQPTAATGQVIVELVGLHSDAGQVLAALFRSADGFPSGATKAYARKRGESKQKMLSLAFDGIPAGPFAISVFHDENNNNAMEKTFIGIPKEGWGMSRDAKPGLGPPSFEDARLVLAPGEHKHIVIHIRY